MKLFLDTNIMNKIVEFGEYIFDGFLADEALERYEARSSRDQKDIDALCFICRVLQYGSVQARISNNSLQELNKTEDENWNRLMNYGAELFEYADSMETDDEVQYWNTSHRDNDFMNAFSRTRRKGDRDLLIDAMASGCDVFLTMDRKSLLRRRNRLGLHGIKLMSPVELADIFSKGV